MKLLSECSSRSASESWKPLLYERSHLLCRPENVPVFIEAVKKREKVLSGFGHRVYKTVGPAFLIIIC